jgi:ubiquinone/menaquinone biosynthesis C-methylase UbiE
MLPLYSERLSDLAAQAYQLSDRLCGSCRDLHALWPYMRLLRSSTGVEHQGSNLEIALRVLIAGGLRKILIAGAADTGLLALVLRAAANNAVHISVLDICETPLELCRRVAREWSLPIDTLKLDLRVLDVQQQFELVLVHGTLHFIAAADRRDVLNRIRRALRPEGRLVLLFNTSKPSSTAEIGDQFHLDYADSIMGELKRLHIALPDDEQSLSRRFVAHSRQRQLREGAFTEPEDVKRLLGTAGFAQLSCSQIKVEVAGKANDFVSRFAKRRFLAVARPGMLG